MIEVPRSLAIVALAVAALCATPVQAAVDRATLERAESLIKSQQAEAAYQLLEPLEAANAGDLVFDFLLASAALESGKPSRATFIYERILAIDPNYVGVRADMGRAYFALGDFGRARIEFETVLQFQNLPPDLRGSVEQYVKAAEARAAAKSTVWTAYVEATFGHDNNIGGATSLRSILFPTFAPTLVPLNPPTGTRTSDRYQGFAVGGEVNHQLGEQWGLYAGLDLRGRRHETYNDPNNMSVDGRAGLSYSGGPWSLRAGVSAGEYVYNGERLRDSVGVNADWRLALDTSSQLSVSAAITRIAYVAASSAVQDTDTYTATLGWLTALGDGTTVVSVSGTVAYEDAIKGRDDGDKLSFGPRLLLQKSFGERVGAFVSAGVTLSPYREINTTFYRFKRRETLTDVTAGISFSVAKGLSLRPQLTYLRNRSNAELYSYDKTDVSLNLRYDF